MNPWSAEARFNSESWKLATGATASKLPFVQATASYRTPDYARCPQERFPGGFRELGVL